MKALPADATYEIVEGKGIVNRRPLTVNR